FPCALGLTVDSLLREDDEEREDFSWGMLSLQVFGIILLAVGACSLATMHFEIAEGITWHAGGAIGSLMVDVTVPSFAVVGSTILYFAIFMLGLTITVEISWLRLVDRIGYWVLNGLGSLRSGLGNWMQTRKEEQGTRQILETR